MTVVGEVMSSLDLSKTVGRCYQVMKLRRPLLLLRWRKLILEGLTVALSTVCEDGRVGWRTKLALALQSVSFCK